jgi:hypothetical protein
MPMRTTEVPWFPRFLLVPRNSVCVWFPGSYPLQGTGTRNRLFGPSPDEVSRNQKPAPHTPRGRYVTPPQIPTAGRITGTHPQPEGLIAHD